jgi:hypothetical protein
LRPEMHLESRLSQAIRTCRLERMSSADVLRIWMRKVEMRSNASWSNCHSILHAFSGLNMVRFRLVHFEYPLVNVYITMENHHFQWENPL